MSHQQSPRAAIDSELIAEVLEQASEPLPSKPRRKRTAATKPSHRALQQQLEEAKQQAAANLDKTIRTLAEMENLKRRAKTRKMRYGLTKFAKIAERDDSLIWDQAATGDSPKWSLRKAAS